MAILKGSDESVAIVASETEKYGLYVGPKGAFHAKGIQVHAPKWANLFTSDEDGVPNLLNVLEYVEKRSNDFLAVEAELDKFIAAYREWRVKREAA